MIFKKKLISSNIRELKNKRQQTKTRGIEKKKRMNKNNVKL